MVEAGRDSEIQSSGEFIPFISPHNVLDIITEARLISSVLMMFTVTIIKEHVQVILYFLCQRDKYSKNTVIRYQ